METSSDVADNETMIWNAEIRSRFRWIKKLRDLYKSGSSLLWVNNYNFSVGFICKKRSLKSIYLSGTIEIHSPSLDR
jgi:hypothetical protein